jgi:hypothetical protein
MAHEVLFELQVVKSGDENLLCAVPSRIWKHTGQIDHVIEYQ